MKDDLNLLPALCGAKRCNTLQLQWFAEGGAGAAESGDASPGQAAAAPVQEPESPGSDEAAKKNAAFEKLIRGEYKEQFSARTQRIIDQRFKQSRGAQQLAKDLARQYGLAPDDYTGIARAAQDSRTADADARREKAQSLEAEYREAGAKQICARWQQEGEELARAYPDFVMQRELTNPVFADLLRAGVPLRTAYEACHLDEILGGAMQFAADKAAAAAQTRAAALARRPQENGVRPSAGSVMQPDVNALTLAQREQIERRVARGERIRF